MSGSADEIVKVLPSMNHVQVLVPRIGGFSNFAICFSSICVLAGAIIFFPLAMATGNGFGVAIGWLAGALIVLAALWFLIRAQRFTGPPVGGEVMSHPRKVAAAEKAAGEIV